MVGLWVSARRFSIRRKVFSGFCPHDLYGKCEAGSFGSQVNLRLVNRRKLAYEADSGSVGTEADGTCLRVTTRASDGRRGSVKAPRGPRRARGEFASSTLKRRRSRGAPESDRPKLTAANSSVDPPPSWPREWPGSPERAPEQITTMAQLGDGPLTQRPVTGGHRAGIER